MSAMPLQQQLLVFVHDERLAGEHGRAHKKVRLVQVLFVRGEHVEVGFLAHGHVECHLKLSPRRYLLLCHVFSPSRGRRYHRRARCTLGYCNCFAAGFDVQRVKWRGCEAGQPLVQLPRALRQPVLAVAARRRRRGLKLALCDKRIDAYPNLGDGESRAFCQFTCSQFAVALECRHN